MNATAKPLYFLSLILWLIFLVGLPWLYSSPLQIDSSAIERVRVLSFLGALAGIVCLVMGIGIQVEGSPIGVLASGRNTYSLSRLQMTLWSLLVISALMAAAACRGWALLDKGSWSTALNIGIPNELFQVMGISFFSGAAAPTILALKTTTPTSPSQLSTTSERMGEPVCATGSVMNRPLSADPKLADMVQGDDVATAGTVDLSKVQQLLITIVLVGVYFAMLANMFFVGVPSARFEGSSTEVSALPPFSQFFVNLLAISHASYLGYKAAPRTAVGGPPSSVFVRPPTPDRSDLTN